MARWSIPIDAFFDEAKEAVTKDARKIIESAGHFLVDVTPVRTGRLRGGYQSAINNDPAFVRPPDDLTGEATKAFISAVAAQFELQDKFKIVNYTPYAIFVNDGTSRQAGQFMIERTISFATSG